MIDRKNGVIGDFEAFLSKLWTVPKDKIKFYIHWVRRFLKSCNYQLENINTERLEAGHNIRTIQELLGHKHVNTTMIYTHVIRKKPSEIRSPLDDL